MTALAAGVVDGVAAESGDGETLDGIGDLRPRDSEADGAAVAGALGAGHDVGRDAPVLDAEPLVAGAAPGGLHFVADEDAAVVAHDALDNREIFLGRRDEARHALNRFADEAGDAAGGGAADQVLHVLGAAHLAIRILQAEGTAVAVGVVGVNHAGVGGPDAPGSLAGERHGLRGTAVIGVAQRHDLRTAGIAARRQNGGFVGFGAAVGEERFGQLAIGRERGDFLGKSRLRFIGVDGGDVLQGVHLAVDLGVDLLIAVAHADGDDAAQKIQVLIAVRVPDVLIFGARYH